MFYDNIIKYCLEVLGIEYDYTVIENKTQFECLNQNKKPFFLPCLKMGPVSICGSEAILLSIT